MAPMAVPPSWKTPRSAPDRGLAPCRSVAWSRSTQTLQFPPRPGRGEGHCGSVRSECWRPRRSGRMLGSAAAEGRIGHGMGGTERGAPDAPRPRGEVRGARADAAGARRARARGGRREDRADAGGGRPAPRQGEGTRPLGPRRAGGVRRRGPAGAAAHGGRGGDGPDAHALHLPARQPEPAHDARGRRRAAARALPEALRRGRGALRPWRSPSPAPAATRPA